MVQQRRRTVHKQYGVRLTSRLANDRISLRANFVFRGGTASVLAEDAMAVTIPHDNLSSPAQNSNAFSDARLFADARLFW
jgi:hypothetical protein